MEKENYLNDITLKIFLFVLYGKGAIDIPATQYPDSDNFVRDIFRHKLQKYFTMVRNDMIFDDTDCNNYLDKGYFDYYLCSYSLKILLSDLYINDLNSFIEKYVKKFELNDLESAINHYYSFDESLLKATRKLYSFSKGINKEFSIKIPLEENDTDKFYEKEVRFYETVFYLILKKYLLINNCSIIKNPESHEYEKQKLDLSITFLKDINSIKGISTEDLDDGNEVVIELNYDEFAGDIYITKGENKTKISSPHYDSPNRVVFEYLYNHSDENIKIEILDDIVHKKLGKSLKKPLRKIPQELGFNGIMKKLFFCTSEGNAKLRKKITKSQLNDIGIDISKIPL